MDSKIINIENKDSITIKVLSTLKSKITSHDVFRINNAIVSLLMNNKYSNYTMVNEYKPTMLGALGLQTITEQRRA